MSLSSTFSTPKTLSTRQGFSSSEDKPLGLAMTAGDQIQIGLFNHQHRIVEDAYTSLQSAPVKIGVTEHVPEFTRIHIQAPMGIYFRRYVAREPKQDRGQVKHRINVNSRYYETHSFLAHDSPTIMATLPQGSPRNHVAQLGFRPLVVAISQSGQLTVSVQQPWTVDLARPYTSPQSPEYVQQLEDALEVIRDQDTDSGGRIGSIGQIAADALRNVS